MTRMRATELLQHVLGASVHRHVQLQNAAQHISWQDVGREHYLGLAAFVIVASAHGALELTQADAVNLCAELTEQAQDVQVRAGFLRETYRVEATERCELPADDLRVVHVERSAVPFG